MSEKKYLLLLKKQLQNKRVICGYNQNDFGQTVITTGSPRKYKVIKGVRGTLNRCASIPENCRYFNEDFRDYDFDRDVKPYIDYDYYDSVILDQISYNFLRLDKTNLYNGNK